MSIFGLPLVMFQIPGDDMGDLEYIEGKVLSGDYFQVSGDINNLNDTIEFTVPSGKTAFLIEAKIVPKGHSDPPPTTTTPFNTIIDNRVQAELIIDSITKDVANVGTVMNSVGFSVGVGASGTGNQNKDKFNVLGLSLVGNNVKKIEIKNSLDNGSALATMSGYLV